MSCSVKCIFFPDSTCTKFVCDENGVKKREEEFQYICGYDGHIITNWNEDCPKENDGFGDVDEIRKHLVDFAKPNLSGLSYLDSNKNKSPNKT